ncbi:hypothetical protein GCM10023232_10560 [Sphingosinicella ginsenosidimutans]|uniref:hypothetical protein n=1 Tax=Allosphingosinicella ginsenosidimutans TaxID=1176539 RepID=UPI00186408C5|nr:hypothetical protein [Sphingosinicella ginsenosidimutans]
MAKPPQSAPHHRAEAVRGGEIELRRPWQRALFIAGLALLVLVAIALGIAGFA